jgi:hypothetical protein
MSPLETIIRNKIEDREQDQDLAAHNGDFKMLNKLGAEIHLLKELLKEAGLISDNKIVKELAHSRACGYRPHSHGRDCHSNCPSCGGKEV